MSALRPGQALCGFPHACSRLREMRPRLCLHRYRRRSGDLHHHAGRCDRGRLRARGRGQVPAAVLAACGTLVSADPRHHAAAAALDEVAADRAAIPPQGGAGPTGRPREMNETARKPRVAGFALFTFFLIAVFVALGVWQLQRRTAKHELVAALTQRLAETPIALPPPAQWA